MGAFTICSSLQCLMIRERIPNSRGLKNREKIANEVTAMQRQVFCNNLLRGKFAFQKKKKKERAWLQSAAWSKDLSKNLAEQSLFRFAFEPKSSLIRRCHISRGDKGRKVITARGNGYTQPSPTRLLVFPYREMRGWEAFPFCGRLRAFPAQKSRTSSHVEFDRIAENWWNSFGI